MSGSFFKLSNIYFLVALIALGGATAYGVQQYPAIQASEQAVSDNGATREKLAATLTEAEKTYQAIATERAEKQKEFSKMLENILPSDEQYTDVTRQLDDFFADHDTPEHPLFQSSLRFGKGTESKTLPGISFLPVSMSIEATRDNFFKFLEFVNSSGSLESGTRLMGITSIQLNFDQEGESLQDPAQKIDFTVDMNTYYQTPKVQRKK